MITKTKPRSVSLDDERIRPDSPDQATFHHHLARYRFALGLLNGAERILDAGCGTGYGTHLLSQHCAEAMGIDYSTHGIAYAQEHFRRPNLRFAVMDCHRLGLPDRSVDLLLSFEVFEHLEDPDLFLSECRRVLVPNGRLLISTPNSKTSSIHMQSIGQEFEFHINLVDAVGFHGFLAKYFSKVDLFGQQRRGSRLYSVLRSLDIWNLRLRLLGARRREKVQRMMGVAAGSSVQPEDWVFTRTQLRQSNNLLAVCHKT